MKSLLDKSNLPKKLLDAVENKSIKTSRYSTFTLNIFKVFLDLYEEGIYKVSVNDLSIAYYNKYSKLLLPNELHPKIYHLGYSQYLQRYETDTGIYYSLREESIDKYR